MYAVIRLKLIREITDSLSQTLEQNAIPVLSSSHDCNGSAI